MSLIVAICDETGRIVQAMHSIHESLDDLAHAAEFPVAEGWTVAYLSPDMDDLARARGGMRSGGVSTRAGRSTICARTARWWRSRPCPRSPRPLTVGSTA